MASAPVERFDPLDFDPFDFDPLDFDPLDFDPLDFDPLDFDPLDFDPLDFDPLDFDPLDNTWESLALPAQIHRLIRRFWRVAAGIPFRVRPAALAEPDLVRYTIRLPAGVIHRGFPRCETNQSCGHGLNPLSVGPCFSDSFSPTDTPSLRPHYRTSSLLWVSPTSARLRPLPRCLGLSEGAHPRVRHLTDLPGYHAFSL